MMDRRFFLGMAGCSLALANGAAIEAAMAQPVGEEIRLWPGVPPGGESVHLHTRIVDQRAEPSGEPDRYADRIDRPLMTMFRPDQPDGSAVIIAPGGGFGAVLIDAEGVEVAQRLNAVGVTAVLLRYRLPAEGWRNGQDVPLQDAQRCIRLLRARAAEFALDPHRIGILGFSAGGYVAASLATRHSEHSYTPVDAADAVGAEPAFVGLMFPVITMGPNAHAASRRALLGTNPSARQIARYSCEQRVTPATPPSFICLAADDKVVSPEANGEAMYHALRASGVPVEFHIFQRGGHAWAIRGARGKPAAAWTSLFFRWLQDGGWVRDARAVRS